MKKVRLNDLGEPFQKAVAEAAGEPIVIEDDQGEARYGVVPYRKPSDQQKQQAWEKLKEYQRRAAASMKKHGVTEDDVMRVILEDD
jgi:hypothetical protein